ncbi:hypothetical protein [Salipiger mucosus]|uniref:hypothetical protein n=1 Tax=Salipiger mucosus TaxID=263378 RepID=UPI0012EBC153|nr:hypothetical protein [Salipiger mucosus]
MKHFSLLPVALVIAGCNADMPSDTAMVTPADGPSALSGKTLSNSDTTLIVNADGTLTGQEATGEAVSGTWTVEDGQWCRTLTQPEAYAGTSCRTVLIEGDQVTLARPDGSGPTYTMM